MEDALIVHQSVHGNVKAKQNKIRDVPAIALMNVQVVVEEHAKMIALVHVECNAPKLVVDLVTMIALENVNHIVQTNTIMIHRIVPFVCLVATLIAHNLALNIAIQVVIITEECDI